MKLDVPYKEVCDIPVELVNDLVGLITEQDWYEYDYRKPMFPTSTNDVYDSILIRHSSEYKTVTIRNMPLYEKFIPKLQPILDVLATQYEYVDYVAFISRLGPGGKIAEHVDGLEFLQRIHRCHVPLRTNPDCYYTVEGEKLHMEVGKVYEIDNMRLHGVMNEGLESRLQLVVNLYPKK